MPLLAKYLENNYPWIFDLNFVLVQALGGLAYGFYLSLVALGLTITFGTCRFVNLAHGGLYMVGAYLAAVFAGKLGEQYGMNSFVGIILITSVLVGILAIAIEIFIFRRIYKRGFDLQIIASFGILLLIGAVIHLIYGPDYKVFPKPEALDGFVMLGEYPFPKYNFLIIAVTPVTMLAMYLLINWTKLGIFIRAASVDRTMVEALGVNINRLMSIVFLISGLTVGFAGALAAPSYSINLNMGQDVILNCLAVIIIGGLGSIPGSFAGALLVGQIQAFGVMFAPSLYSIFIYLVVLIVLIARPLGLMGKSEGRADEEGIGQ